MSNTKSAVAGYKITNTEGRRGRGWCDLFGSQAEGIHEIGTLMGWEEPVASEPFTVTDGDGREVRAWCVYSSQEECDADGEGADAPRVVEVLTW